MNNINNGRLEFCYVKRVRPFREVTVNMTFLDQPCFPGKEHSCQCTQGNMAHLQTHQVGQKDRSCKGAETPAQVSSSHSPVSPTLCVF